MGIRGKERHDRLKGGDIRGSGSVLEGGVFDVAKVNGYEDILITVDRADREPTGEVRRRPCAFV